MNEWLQIAHESVASGQPCALLMVTRTEGSTPREAGARMLVCADAQHGTIGGGKLELDACERARALLAAPETGELGTTQVYNLGASLGQCCGGRVELLIQRFGAESRSFLERLLELEKQEARYVCALSIEPGANERPVRVQRTIVTRDAGGSSDPRVAEEAQRVLRSATRLSAPRWLEPPIATAQARVLLDCEPERGLPLVLFGAGHVGRALVHVLGPLGWSITWVETRDDAFPSALPPGVEALTTDSPEACIDEAALDSAFLIMTHDHALDYRLCERVLRRSDFVYCGLIGSRTKRAKFMHRLSARGFSAEAIARITCPIGLPQLTGKAPFEVAIAAAAQLLQLRAELRAHSDRRPLATVHPVHSARAAHAATARERKR